MKPFHKGLFAGFLFLVLAGVWFTSTFQLQTSCNIDNPVQLSTNTISLLLKATISNITPCIQDGSVILLIKNSFGDKISESAYYGGLKFHLEPNEQKTLTFEVSNNLVPQKQYIFTAYILHQDEKISQQTSYIFIYGVGPVQ